MPTETRPARAGVKPWTWAAGLIVVAATAEAAAQSVAVRLLESGSDRPIPGAIVTLTPSATRGAPIRRLADEAGWARFDGVAPGWHRVRVERIGHRPLAADSLLVGAEPATRMLRLEPAPFQLPEITVSADNACGAAALDREGVVDLWSEVRTNLETSRLITQDRARRFRVVTRQRILDDALRLSRVRADTVDRPGFRPFEAVRSEQLEQVGYIVPDGVGFRIFGPDEEQLLSPHFAATHCFGIVRRGARIGLSFRPAPRRTLPDIAGVMWIDRQSRLLELVEFTYFNVPDGLRAEGLAGRTEFGDLAGAGRHVKQWWIRVPLVERRRFSGGRAIEVVAGYREDGGEAWPLALIATRPAEAPVVVAAAPPVPPPAAEPAVRPEAPAPSPPPAPRPGRDRNLITAEELAGRPELRTALDAIRALRPTWLRPVRPHGRVGQSLVEATTDTTSGLPTAYAGTARLSGPDDLQQFLAAEVVEIRYIPGLEATRLRPSDTFGAIVLVIARNRED
jgi:hypothetical protein